MIKRIILFLFPGILFLSCDYKYSSHKVSEVPDFNNDFYDNQLNYIDQQLKGHSADAMYLYKKALFLHQLQKNSEAVSVLKQALEYDQNNESLQLLAAKLFLENEDYEKAAKAIAYLEQSQANSPAIDEVKARLKLANSELDEADELVDQAINKDPYNADYYYLKGKIKWQREDTLAAEEYYLKSIEITPDEIVYKELMDVLMAREDYKRANTYLDKLINLQPGNENLYFQKGIIFKNQENYDSARLYLKRSLELDSKFKEAYHQLALVSLNTYQYDSVNYYTEQALKLDPGYLPAYFTLAQMYDRRSWNSRAIGYYQKILEIEPENQIAQQELEKLYRKVAYLQQIKKAKEELKEKRQIETIKPKEVEKVPK